MIKIFTFILLIISVSSYSQEYVFYEIDFEDTSQFFRIEIDTVSKPNNIWKIGKPQKKLFNSAFSLPNAIVTDTASAYPINDTSSFTITHVASWISGFQSSHAVGLYGIYQVNSDSLNDFGMLEFSPDNGITWVNLLTDTLYLKQECYEWYISKPTLTGNSNGWTYLSVSVAGFGRVFNIFPGDTVLYRFSFISDSIQTNKDGLIFDDLQFTDITEGINKIHNQFGSKVYPNPTSGLISIEFENKKSENFLLTIYNIQGQIILNKEINKDGIVLVDIENNKPGIYYYMLNNLKSRQFSWGKIIKN